MLQAILAAISGSAGDVSNKFLLSKLKIPVKDYLPFIFSILTIISLFLIPVNYHFDGQALSFKYILLLLLMIACAATWNILLAKSLQNEPLHEYETIILMVPLITVLLAAVFLPVERNLHVFIAAIVASLALFLSRIKKHHFQASQNAKRTFMAVILIAIESVALRQLLNFYSPPLLYFIRVLILAIVFFIIYKPDFKILLEKPIVRGLILSASFGTGVMVLKYYAFQQIGVVQTTMILLLTPIMTYFASYFYFKEHRNFKRDIICAGVVVLCIIYSTVVK